MQWKHERRELSTLYENPNNPRFISKKAGEHLKKSLDKFGQCESIVIQPDGEIIGGHQRFRLLKKKKEKYIDVSVPEKSLTKKDAAELSIRLNKNQGDWDFDTLANLWDPELLLESGFTLEELHLDLVEEEEKPKSFGLSLKFECEEDLKEAQKEIEEIVHRFPLASCKSKIR